MSGLMLFLYFERLSSCFYHRTMSYVDGDRLGSCCLSVIYVCPTARVGIEREKDFDSRRCHCLEQ